MTVWAITGDAELRQALTDPRLVRGYRHWRALAEGEINPQHPIVNALRIDNMITANGADHRRLRTLVAKEFTSRRVREQLTPRIQEITAELIGEMARAGADGAVVDLKDQFARPLPMRVICELLGIPHPDAGRLAAMVTRAFSGADLSANQDLFTYLEALLATKRAEPGKDLLSALIATHDEEGDRLSDIELLHTASLLCVAGFDTTMGALTNITRLLLQRPDYQHQIRSGLLPWDRVIEEGLRHQPPVWVLPMLFPVEDITIAGHTIGAGEPIFMGFAAANHDPHAYGPTAGEFNPYRESQQHLAFGHGAHYCLGAHLARAELQVALPALFEHFPTMQLAPQTLAPLPSAMTHHPGQLLVRLTSTPHPRGISPQATAET